MRGLNTGRCALKGAHDENWPSYCAAFVPGHLENLDAAPLVFRCPLLALSGHLRYSLGYRPPAPETILPPASILAYAPLQPVQKTTLTLALWAVEGEKSDGAVDIDGMSVVGTI